MMTDLPVQTVLPEQLEYQQSLCILVTRSESWKDGALKYKSVYPLVMGSVEDAEKWVNDHVSSQTQFGSHTTGFAILEIPLDDVNWQEPPE
jgi:hypothetical protein